MEEYARQGRKSLATTALTLSVVLMGMGVRVPEAWAEAPAGEEGGVEESVGRVGLRVETEDLGSGGEAMKGKIEETARGVFEGEGYGEAREDEDPEIVVVVERTGTEENPGYVVGFSIEKGDEIVPGSARQSDCSLCTRTELLKRIEEELGGVLELAGEHQVVEAEEVGTGDGDGDVGEETGEEKKIGALGIGGIGLGVLGLTGVWVWVGLVVKGVEPQSPDYLQQVNYKTPGAVVLAVGGVALIAGAVMLVVDVSKRKKARSKGQAGSKAHVRPHGLGIAF